MKGFKTLYCLLLLSSFVANSQQNNNWYFGGKAALSFNTNGTQPVPTILTNSAMLASEAAAAISNKDGDLLFYTNGVEVYNNTHKLMLNGDGLKGHVSSCQVAIVPLPGSETMFYIFTTDAIEKNYVNGYNYSIVDMTRDNGKGEVIVKNVPLFASCTERLTTARHFNGVDVWIITNDNSSNIFRAWLLTCTGLQSPEVISTVGNKMDQFQEMNSGIMKVSPDGKTFCQVHFPDVEVTTIPNYIQLFDFDNATGVISNPRKISFADAAYTHGEFSPDSKMLYLSRPYDKKIDQLQISLPTVAAIQASRVSFATIGSYYDMQLAPDEKIYVSQPGPGLAAIHQPNVPGTGCNFIQNSIETSPGGASLGLPSFINDVTYSNDPNNGFSYTIMDSCSGTVQFNGHSIMPPTVTWEWDFGDGHTDNVQNPLHVFDPSGSFYTVKLKISSSLTCGTVYRSARIKPSGVIISKPDFDYVVRCDSGYVRFINKTKGLQDISATITWEFGDNEISHLANPVHTYLTTGRYFVKLKLTTTLACLDDEKIIPVDVKDFTVNTPPDITILVGQQVFLSTDAAGTTYQWSPAKWLSNDKIRNPVATPLEDIIYTVNATNGDGCKGKDSTMIHVLQYKDIYVPSAFTPNNDGKNEEIKPFYPGTYELKEFAVFDRWGQKIFTTSQRNGGWDGKVNGILKSSDVYVWMGIFIDSHTGQTVNRKGTFTLIR